METNTIAAISTPLGSGGIGVVRLSGPQAIAVARRLFAPKGNLQPTGEEPGSEEIVSHQLRLGYIRDPQTGDVIDEVLLVVMISPHSYTREDVVEIQSHAGFAVLSRILRAVLDAGAQMAEPGEFTKRAFLNGRIDLSQAGAEARQPSARCLANSSASRRSLTACSQAATGNAST